MHLKRTYGVVLSALGLFTAGAIPAQAVSAASPEPIVISQLAASDTYQSTLTVQLDQTVSASATDQVKSSLENTLSSIQPDAGPTGGAFLICNKAHLFTDGDGTFSFQHACGGTTGPWGYRLSAGLCTIVISDVTESGMAWTRNGTRQGRQSPHVETCRYQFHGNFNPDKDFDLISYSDTFVFRVDVGGETGTADLDIKGSFYSAECTNPTICP